MRILVLGGTYFLGKAFVEQACKKHEVVLLNRGTRKVCFSHPEHIRELALDRHSLMPGMLADIGQAQRSSSERAEGSCVGAADATRFDVIVDFCAYEAGDIRQIIDALGQAMPRRYLFVSTTDVYRRGTGETLDENAPLEERDFGGQAGAYILGKAALERELAACAKERGFSYTAVRPAFIYGPGNYAPREDLFFYWIGQAGQVIVPADETGRFRMVYVEDVARVICRICGCGASSDEEQLGHGLQSGTYDGGTIPDGGINVLGPSDVTYESFCDALAQATGRSFEKIPVSVEEIGKRQIPLPFPLCAAESERYESRYDGILGIQYTPLAEGLKITYEAWRRAQDGDTEMSQK